MLRLMIVPRLQHVLLLHELGRSQLVFPDATQSQTTMRHRTDMWGCVYMSVMGATAAEDLDAARRYISRLKLLREQ
jgi:hypothetical protein